MTAGKGSTFEAELLSLAMPYVKVLTLAVGIAEVMDLWSS